jgi:hypothetical protein
MEGDPQMRLLALSRIKLIFLVFVSSNILLLAPKVFSIELYNRSFSVRALGMGNAFTPIAKGTDALFYNPAGLAKTKEITLTALKFRVGVDNVDAISNANDFNGSGFANTLRQFYGKELWVGTGLVSGFSTPNFAAAIYDSFNLSADLSNPALPSFQVDFVNDYGIATGFGLDLAPGFSVGVAVKRINRIGSSAVIPVSALANLTDTALRSELDNRGLGYSLDFGTSITFPTPVKPTLSFVMKNLGDTQFTLDKGTKNPPTDKGEMIAGLSLEMEVPGVTVIPVIEMKNIASTETIALGKKIHTGLELQLPALALRGGLYQGYYTAGVGLNLGIINLDVATYGVELGEYPGQHEDRRYVLELTIDFGFDPSKGVFLGLNKENRKNLKQRR